MCQKTHSLLESSEKCYCCNHPVPLQIPGTPEPQKCILKSEKCQFGPPRKNGRKSPLKSQNESFLGNENVPKMDVLDISMDFCGHCSEGVQTSRSPKAGHPKDRSVGFSKSAMQTRYREYAENADVPPTPQENKGLRRFRRTKTRKMRTRKRGKIRKMRMTGFHVTGFR